jgi:hypothetical protein
MGQRLRFVGFLAVWAAAGMGTGTTGCIGPLDILGTESVSTDESSNRTEPTDDRIEDKHPVYDPTRIVTETFPEDCPTRLNKSGSVAKLDIAPLAGVDQELADLIFPNRAAAAAYLDAMGPTAATLIPSMEVVNGAMKPFNDGLYAAIEVGVEDGLESSGTTIYPAKRQFLHDLLAAVLALQAGAPADQLVHINAAAVDLGAALLLGGEDPVMPADLRTAAAARVAAFDAEPVIARPIGFYGWSTALSNIYRQDRYLQNYLVEFPIPGDPYTDSEIGKAAAIAVALEADAELLDRYQGYLALYAGLTNPFANFSVDELLPYVDGVASLSDPAAIRTALLADHPWSGPTFCRPHLAVFPTSKSRETTYYESLWCDDGVPAGVNIMDTLIQAIRDGLVDLAPVADSGWYDYQSYALETLLLPERATESQHLLLTAAYKKKLMDTFRSIMTQNRETHVRQLEMGGGMGTAEPAREFDIYPLYPVEPFPTFYLRSARAYRFLAVYLEGVLGAEFMDTVHRLTEDGTTNPLSLADELHQKTAMLYGLHLVAADSVGMAPELLADEMAEYPDEECRLEAALWLNAWRTEPDVARDPRVIVPVQNTVDGFVVYWAVTGVRVIKARTEFVAGFEPQDITPVGSACTFRKFVSHEYTMLVESFAEVRRPADAPPLTREEYRAICDGYDTQAEIVAALEAP